MHTKAIVFYILQVTLLVPFVFMIMGVYYSVLFTTDSTALSNAFFGTGTGPIYLDHLACVGTEPTLTICTHDTHTADCGHNEDASVHCNIRKLYCLSQVISLEIKSSTVSPNMNWKIEFLTLEIKYNVMK